MVCTLAWIPQDCTIFNVMPYDPEAVRQQLFRIVDSRMFRNAERLRAFLRFVVEETLAGREGGIKEYAIACEVCGRAASFDPKTDPIVRVDANRLRSRLESYYQNEGTDDPVLISLPKGAYIPVFSERPASIGRTDDAISLAVLPFATLGPTGEYDHFADGLTEELIHLLARFKGLKVMARSSVFQFKRSSADPRDVGNRLGVKYVLEGTLRVTQTRIRVTVQLIETIQGWLVWSDKYERAWHDVLDVQDEIAASITDALKIHLEGTGESSPFTHVTEDPDTYAHYLRGRYYWHQRTPEALSMSVKCYEMALARDPGCAPAHAGLADTLAVMALNDQEPTAAVMPRAHAAARRALELRPGWPEALASSGFIKSVFDWDWDGGARDFKEAIQRQPSFSTAHYLFAIGNLTPRGFWTQAVSSLQTALSLDPVSPLLMRDLGLIYFMKRAWGDAEDSLLQAETLAPGYRGCLYWRARLLIETGETEKAIAALQARLAAGGANTRVLATIAYAQARGGVLQGAVSILDELTTRARTQRVPPLDFATIQLGLGKIEHALDSLERAFQEKAATLYQFGIDPLYDPVRSHPRGQALQRALGLPTITFG
jgi:serine/threonine-protein kinase